MADKSRLEKLVGMLGSDHDGEILAAVRFIRKMAEDDKLTIPELLSSTLGKERERIVYKEPERRPDYDWPRHTERRWSGFHRRYDQSFREREREPEPEINDREILDGLKEIAASDDEKDCLDLGMQDFVNSVPYQYDFDWQLSGPQRRLARVILRTWKRRNAEPLI